MKKYLSLLLLTVLCGLNATAQNVIKMTTTQAVGNTFKMLVTTVDGKEPQLTGAKLKSTWKNTALLTYEVVAAEISIDTRVKGLTCSNMALTALDVTQATDLVVLNCHNNKLHELNLTQNKALSKLTCSNNQLTELQLSNCTALTVLYCQNNLLHNLDLSANSKLQTLELDGNGLKGKSVDQLIALLPDRSKIKKAGKLYCVNSANSNETNVFTKAQVAGAKAKNWVTYDAETKNYYEGTEDMQKPENVIRLTTGKNIGDKIALTVTGKGTVTIEGVAEPLVLNFPNVYTLTSQEIKIVGKVKTLTCADNLLTAIDVSQAPTLTYLECSRNQLTSLNVDNNVALKRLVCMENKLTSLNLSQNSELFRLDCALNSISGVEMEKLVNSLPDRNSPKTAGTLVVKSITHEAEANECTTGQVQIAKGKNWNVMALNGDDAEPYTGTESTAVPTTTQDAQAVVAVACYDPSGRQLGTLTRGINIVKMSDGTTRKVIGQ